MIVVGRVVVLGAITRVGGGGGGDNIRGILVLPIGPKAVRILYINDPVPKPNFGDFDEAGAALFAHIVGDLNLGVLTTFFYFLRSLNIRVIAVAGSNIEHFLGLYCTANEIISHFHFFFLK